MPITLFLASCTPSARARLHAELESIQSHLAVMAQNFDFVEQDRGNCGFVTVYQHMLCTSNPIAEELYLLVSVPELVRAARSDAQPLTDADLANLFAKLLAIIGKPCLLHVILAIVKRRILFPYSKKTEYGPQDHWIALALTVIFTHFCKYPLPRLRDYLVQFMGSSASSEQHGQQILTDCHALSEKTGLSIEMHRSGVKWRRGRGLSTALWPQAEEQTQKKFVEAAIESGIMPVAAELRPAVSPTHPYPSYKTHTSFVEIEPWISQVRIVQDASSDPHAAAFHSIRPSTWGIVTYVIGDLALDMRGMRYLLQILNIPVIVDVPGSGETWFDFTTIQNDSPVITWLRGSLPRTFSASYRPAAPPAEISAIWERFFQVIAAVHTGVVGAASAASHIGRPMGVIVAVTVIEQSILHDPNLFQELLALQQGAHFNHWVYVPLFPNTKEQDIFFYTWGKRYRIQRTTPLLLRDAPYNPNDVSGDVCLLPYQVIAV